MCTMCLEKCVECGKKDLSCCEMTPLWKESELAYFNYKSDYLENNNTTLKVSFLREYNRYIVTNRSDIKNDKVVLSNTCVFYDTENHKCKIYEYRPEQCRAFGEKDQPCIFTNMGTDEVKDYEPTSEEKFKIVYDRLSKYGKEQAIITGYMLPKVKSYSKKDIKNMKEDMLLYLILNSFNNLRDMWEDNGFMTFSHSYGLIFVDYKGRKALNSVQYSKAHTDIWELKPLTAVYNKLNKRFVLKDPMYVEILVQKIRKLMKGIALKEVGTDNRDITSYLGSVIPLVDIHSEDFKNKNFKDLIRSDDLFTAKKWLLRQKGSDTIFNIPKEIEALYANADMIFKTIMKQR